MGVSFKVAKLGTRYRPKLPPPDPPAGAGEKEAAPDAAGDAPDPKRADLEVALLGLGDGFAGSVLSANSESNPVGPEQEVSFSLNLFPDGFSIGKPTKGVLLPLLEDAPKLLHPYDRASKALFSAIECGWLPGDILDDIPCKYFNGTLICEVRDYRSCMLILRNNVSSGDELPKVRKVCLRMGMENVVKNMPSISDDSWTYNDLLQAESQILKALQPVLYLGPNPSLARLCRTGPKQLDLGIYKRKVMRKQDDMVEVNYKSSKLDMSSNGYVENLKSQTSVASKNDSACHSQNAILRSVPPVQRNESIKNVIVPFLPLAFQPSSNLVVGSPLSVPNSVAAASNFVSTPDQNLRDSWIGLKNPTNLLGKRNRSRTQSTSKTSGKRPKQEPPDLVSSQIVTSQGNSLLEQESQGNTAPAQKHQEAQNMQHLRFHDQNSSHHQRSQASIERIRMLEAQMPSFLDQEHVQHIVKEEPGDTEILRRTEEKDREGHAPDIRSEKFRELQTPSVGALPSQMLEIGAGPTVEKYPKNPKKEKASRKRKPSQGLQVSAGGSDSKVPKLGESQRIPSSCGTLPTVTAVGLYKDKAASVPAASAGTVSVNPVSSRSLILESQLTIPKKKKSNALNKVTSQSMSGIGSPAHIGESNASFGSNSSSLGTGLLPPGTNVDPSILERFSKIKMASQRRGLNSKGNKIDEYLTTQSLSECSLPQARLVMPEDTEECGPLTENLCMSKYLIGGSRNAPKIRKITFVRVRFFFRGNDIPFLVDESRCKLILTESEEPGRHEVRAEVVFGNEEQRFLIALLHTPHDADLFAAQFTLLMERDGYKLVDDQFQPLSSHIRGISCDSAPVGSSRVTLQPCTTPVTNQSLKPISASGVSFSALNPWQFPPQNIQMPSRTSTLSFNLTRQPQSDIVNLHSVQQQNPQFQSSLPAVWNNSHTNMYKNNMKANSTGHLSTDMQMGSVQMGSATPNSIAHLDTNMQMSTTPNSIAYLSLPRLQQSKWQNYQQQSTLQNNMAIFGATNNITCMGERESGLNVYRNNDHLAQMPGFSHSGQQLLQRGTSETSAAVLTKLRQADNQGMGVTNGSITVGSSAQGIFGMIGDGSLLDQFQCRDTLRAIFSNKQFLNLGSDNYDQQHQQNMRPRGNLQLPFQQLQQQLVSQNDLPTVNQSIRQLQQQLVSQNDLPTVNQSIRQLQQQLVSQNDLPTANHSIRQLQQQLVSQNDLPTANQSIRQLQQQQLGSPQQHDLQRTPISPKRLSSGSATQRVTTDIANAGSPLVSLPTGAGGGIAKSPMLQGPQKDCYHGKGFMKGQ